MDLYRRAEYRPFVAMRDGGEMYRVIGTRQDGWFVVQKLGPAANYLDLFDPTVLEWTMVASYLD
jgi:hypothetical protein